MSAFLYPLMDILIGIIICGLVGLVIGWFRNSPVEGLLWGFFLGPIGWLTFLMRSLAETKGKKMVTRQVSASERSRPDGE